MWSLCYLQFGKGSTLSDFEWAAKKAVITPFIDIFDGLRREDIEDFIYDSDKRASSARLLSVRIDSQPELRAVINKHVGSTLGERVEVFCKILKRLAEEFVGLQRRDLTRFAF